MREILFRGKCIANGEWVYGDLLNVGVDYDYAIRTYGGREHGQVNAVNEKTVGQYTGLTDKNGKKIFEGDIIFCSQEINGNFIDKHIEKGYVEMKHGAFGLHRKQGYYRPFKDWLEDYEYEIIGNIHDNPELLEVK